MALPKDIQLANELEEVMEQRTSLEAEFEEKLTPLKEREEAIRSELTKYLIKIGRDFTRTNSGLGFGLVSGRVTWGVKKGIGTLQSAVQWAMEQHLEGILSISAPALTKVLEGKFVGAKIDREVPDCFERKEGEAHLSVRTSEV